MTSYWSLSSDKTGGVSILQDPTKHDSAPWHPKLWTKRILTVLVEGVLVVRVYAPNDRQERENFFSELRRWPWPDTAMILFGDFYCVQNPHLDRLGGSRSGRPENPALTMLLQALDLEDAITLAGAAMEDEVTDLTDYYTFWTARSASRIDRFYKPTTSNAAI